MLEILSRYEIIAISKNISHYGKFETVTGMKKNAEPVKKKANSQDLTEWHKRLKMQKKENREARAIRPSRAITAAAVVNKNRRIV